MAEEFGFDECGRERRDVDGEEKGCVFGEGEAAVVEGDIARLANGARGQLLAGARRSGDQSRELAHAGVERTAVATNIVSEDGLPNAGAQACGGHGAADDVGKDLVEG